MPHIYKATTWQGSVGDWYCNDVEDLPGRSPYWWVPCRILKITPVEYVKMLVEEFHVSRLSYSKEKNVLCFSWNKDNGADAARYCTFINKKAKEAKFIC